MRKRSLPEINAGSMADIAFLLLIFFLVTTTMDIDAGIFRKIPPKNENTPITDVHDRNIFEVFINKNNEVSIDDEVIEVSSLKKLALNFIDNGAGFNVNQEPCTWCKGQKDPKSSDHPQKALIAIEADREANYETYITVLDHVNGAYSILRNRLALELYDTSYSELMESLNKDAKNKAILTAKIKNIREKYPLLIADLETGN